MSGPRRPLLKNVTRCGVRRTSSRLISRPGEWAVVRNRRFRICPSPSHALTRAGPSLSRWERVANTVSRERGFGCPSPLGEGGGRSEPGEGFWLPLSLGRGGRSPPYPPVRPVSFARLTIQSRNALTLGWSALRSGATTQYEISDVRRRSNGTASTPLFNSSRIA